MRKFLLTFLTFTVASAAFAEVYWSLSSSFNTQLFSMQTALGERAEKSIQVLDINGVEQTVYNGFTTFNFNPNTSNNTSPLGFNRGYYSYFSDSRNFFAYGRGIWSSPNSLRFTLGYTNNYVTLHTRTYLDRLVRTNEDIVGDGVGKNDFSPSGSEHSFVTGDGKTPNWSAILRYAFEEWYVMGTAGFLTGYVGITSNTGKVETFDNQSDTLLRGTAVPGYGVNATVYRDADSDGVDTNNLLRSGAPGTELQEKSISIPYFMIAARLENFLPFPLTFQIAADPGNNGGIGSDSDSGYMRLHGAVRISGENIINRINIDAIYKIAGGNPVLADDYDPIYNPGGTLKPSLDGFFVHNYGVYANVMDVFGLDFGLGYGAYVKTFESLKKKETGDVITKNSPHFHGFDFRVRFTGVDRLVITSFNKLSFCKTEEAATDRYVIGVTGMQLPGFTSQEYLSWCNSITIVYKLADKLDFSAQAGFQYGLITTYIFKDGVAMTSLKDGKRAVIERERNIIGGGIFAAYRFSYFNMQIGIAMRSVFDSYSNTGLPPQPPLSVTQGTIAGFRNASGGALDFGIPVQLTFRF